MRNTITHNVRGLRATPFGRICIPSQYPTESLEKVTPALSTPFGVFTLSKRKSARGQANWNCYSSTTCCQEWEFLAATAPPFIASFPAARVHVSTLFRALRPGEAALAAESCEVTSRENTLVVLWSASSFWKWVCKEEQSAASDVTRAWQKCSTRDFLKLVQIQKGWNSLLNTVWPSPLLWQFAGVKCNATLWTNTNFGNTFVVLQMLSIFLGGRDIHVDNNIYAKQEENM